MKDHVIGYFKKNLSVQNLSLENVEQKYKEALQQNSKLKIALLLFLLCIVYMLAYPREQAQVTQTQILKDYEYMAQFIAKQNSWLNQNELTHLLSKANSSEQSQSFQILGETEDYYLNMGNDIKQYQKVKDLSIVIRKNNLTKEFTIYITQQVNNDPEDIYLVDKVAGRIVKKSYEQQQINEKLKIQRVALDMNSELQKYKEENVIFQKQLEQCNSTKASLQIQVKEKEIEVQQMKNQERQFSEQLLQQIKDIANQGKKQQQQEEVEIVHKQEPVVIKQQEKVLCEPQIKEVIVYVNNCTTNTQQQSQETCNLKPQEQEIPQQHSNQQQQVKETEIQTDSHSSDLSVGVQTNQCSCLNFNERQDIGQLSQVTILEEIGTEQSFTHQILLYVLLGISIIVIFKSIQKEHRTDFLIFQGSIGLVQEVFFWIEIFGSRTNITWGKALQYKGDSQIVNDYIVLTFSLISFLIMMIAILYEVLFPLINSKRLKQQFMKKYQQRYKITEDDKEVPNKADLSSLNNSKHKIINNSSLRMNDTTFEKNGHSQIDLLRDESFINHGPHQMKNAQKYFTFQQQNQQQIFSPNKNLSQSRNNEISFEHIPPQSPMHLDNDSPNKKQDWGSPLKKDIQNTMSLDNLSPSPQKSTQRKQTQSYKIKAKKVKKSADVGPQIQSQVIMPNQDGDNDAFQNSFTDKDFHSLRAKQGVSSKSTSPKKN